MWRSLLQPRLLAPVVAIPVLAAGSVRRPCLEAQVVPPLKEEELDAALFEKVKFFKDPSKGTLGVIPNSVKTMAYRPRLAHAFVELNMAAMHCDGDLTYEFKRLLGYVTSLTQGCNY